MGNVATNRLFETDDIIVWEMVLEPGESTGLHTHEHDFMFYVTQGSVLEISDKDGRSIIEDDVEAGRTMQFEVQGEYIELVGPEPARIPRTHQARISVSSSIVKC